MREWLRALYRYYSTTSEWPEPRRDRSGHFVIPDDSLSRAALTLGQVIVSILFVLFCIPIAIGMIGSVCWLYDVELVTFPRLGTPSLGYWLSVIVSGMISAVFWLALFFAFGRAKWVVRLVECQQAVLAKLLDRLDAPPGGDPLPTVDNPARVAGDRPPGDELVLAVVEARAIVGGWVLLECDDGGWRVPALRGGEAVEVRWPDGRTVSATVAGEERHVRTRRPGRVAFTLSGSAGLADVAGAIEVRFDLRR